MHTVAPVTGIAELATQSNRRHGSRTPTIFSLLYSGMDSGQILMGDGGFGIRRESIGHSRYGAGPLIDLPELEKPLCIAQSQVSWVEGSRFSVELGPLKLEKQNSLRFFLSDRVTPPSDRDRDI